MFRPQPETEIPEPVAKTRSRHVFFMFFYPATFFYYIFFRRIRWRPRVTFWVALVLAGVSFLVFWVSDPKSRFLSVIDEPTGIILPLVSLWLCIVVITGWIQCLLEGHWFKKYPAKLEVPTLWSYKYKYSLSPLERLKKKKTIEALQNGTLCTGERTTLGLDEENNKVVSRYRDESVKHTLVTGAVGSGKTITLSQLILNDIINGDTVIAIDFKGSGEFAARLAHFAHEYDREFYHFTSTKNYNVNEGRQCAYDPLASGNATSKADRIVNMREWDTASEVYKQALQNILMMLVAAIDRADRNKPVKGNIRKIDFSRPLLFILEQVINDNECFYELCERVKIDGVPDDENKLYLGLRDAYTIMSAPGGRLPDDAKKLRNALDELRGKIRTIVASDYGVWLDKNESVPTIDVEQFMKTGGKVILFSINANGERDFAKFMGGLIISDITTASGTRFENPPDNYVDVYVDEFQTVSSQTITALLDKGREAKIAVTLGLQSIAQIPASVAVGDGRAVMESILDVCTNFYVHAGAKDETAKILAGQIGRMNKPTYSAIQTDQKFFATLDFFGKEYPKAYGGTEETWKFPPEKFTSLQIPSKSNGFKSTAVILKKVDNDSEDPESGGTARVTWMIPDSLVLQKYANPSLGGSGLSPMTVMSATTGLSPQLSMSPHPAAVQTSQVSATQQPQAVKTPPNQTRLQQSHRTQQRQGQGVSQSRRQTQLSNEQQLRQMKARQQQFIQQQQEQFPETPAPPAGDEWGDIPQIPPESWGEEYLQETHEADFGYDQRSSFDNLMDE